MKRTAYIAIAVLFLSASFKSAQNDSENEVFKVIVDITFDNETLRNQMESYIKRELRSLNDVSIVENASNCYDYRISIVALEDKFDSEKISIATALLKNTADRVEYASAWVDNFNTAPEDSTINKNIKDSIKVSLSVDEFKTLGVSIITKEQIRSFCEDKVASLDIQMLQHKRKSNEQWKEFLKKLK